VNGGGDIWSNLIWVIMFMVFMFFYPRLVLTQMLWKLEQIAEALELMTIKASKIVLRGLKKKPSKKVKESVKRFLEFFVISPVSLDPYGIIKKFELLMDQELYRFKYFVNQIAPDLDEEKQANIIMGLSGAMTLNQLAKLLRHFVELIRKTKNIQLALILQMQVPMIERIAKALLRGTEALTNGWPIGDSIGAYIAATLIGNSKTKEIEEDTIMARRKIKGRECIIIKAKGPGGRTGKPGKAVEKLTKREKIVKIITIDAAAKLEGEKTGSIAEGVGVAMGGIGVQKNYIEEVAVKRNIPLDSIVIKMSQEEAIQPMKKRILESEKDVLEAVENAIIRTNKKGKIIIVGVGNTSGIGNNKKAAEDAKKTLKKIWKKMKRRSEGRKRFGF
jgi:hypothetical protein